MASKLDILHHPHHSHVGRKCFLPETVLDEKIINLAKARVDLTGVLDHLLQDLLGCQYILRVIKSFGGREALTEEVERGGLRLLQADIFLHKKEVACPQSVSQPIESDWLRITPPMP